MKCTECGMTIPKYLDWNEIDKRFEYNSTKKEEETFTEFYFDHIITNNCRGIQKHKQPINDLNEGKKNEF